MTTRNKFYAIGAIVVSIYVAGFASGWVLSNRPAQIVISQPTPETKTIVVEKPVITEKVVTQLVVDPKTRQQVDQLLAQNAQLQAQVTALTVTEAHTESHGSGVVETVPASTTESPAVVQYHFKDWRLDFTTDTKSASYTLSQRFEILHTTGRMRDGQPLSLVRVFEIGENQERMAIPATTTAIFSDQTRWHWQTGIRVQAGLAMTLGLSRTVTTSGAVGVQWLSNGRTHAAEDSRYALLTPVVTVAGGNPEVGILPLSYNLGQIPHQPFKDVWVSPFVGVHVTPVGGFGVSKIGFSITSSF